MRGVAWFPLRLRDTLLPIGGHDRRDELPLSQLLEHVLHAGKEIRSRRLQERTDLPGPQCRRVGPKTPFAGSTPTPES